MQTDLIDNTVSGSIQDGIVAPYDFEIMDVLKEAWQRTSGLKGSVLGAGAFILIGLAAIGFAIILLLNFIPLAGEGGVSIVAVAFNFIIAVFSYPFIVGIMMMGLHQAVEAPVSYKMAFAYFSYTLPIIITSICMTIMISLGFFLLIIPGIYLSIAYIFTLLLIVDKNMDFWQAMETSRKAVTQHWFKLLFIYILMGGIYLISIIPLGLGLIWTLRMLISLQGVLYRRIFGIDSI